MTPDQQTIRDGEDLLLRTVENQLESVTKHFHSKWIMCSAANGNREFRDAASQHLRKIENAGYALINLERYRTEDEKNNSIRFLKDLCDDWAIPDSDLEFDPDTLYKTLQEIIRRANEIHSKLFLQMNQIEHLINLDTAMIGALRTEEGDGHLATVIVGKWSRSFLIDVWAKEYKHFFGSSEYGNNHATPTVDLMNPEQLIEFLDLPEPCKEAVDYLIDYTGGFYSPAKKIKEAITQGALGQKFLNLCKKPDPWLDGNDLQLPPVNDSANELFAALDPPGQKQREWLEHCLDAFASTSLSHKFYNHCYSDYLYEDGSIKSRFAREGLEEASRKAINEGSITAGLDTKNNRTKIHEKFRQKNWGGIAIRWPLEDISIPSNETGLQLIQAHYLYQLFDVLKSPRNRADGMLKFNTELQSEAFKIADSSICEISRYNAMEVSNWFKKHENWLSDLKNCRGFDGERLVPAVTESAVNSATYKNDFKPMKTVFRLIKSYIDGQRSPKAGPIPNLLDDILQAHGMFLFQCSLSKPSESIIQLVAKFQRSLTHDLVVLNNRGDSFFSMKSYLKFLAWYSTKDGCNQPWISESLLERYNHVGPHRNALSHTTAVNNRDAARVVIDEICKELFNNLIRACMEKWPEEKLDEGLNDVLPYHLNFP